MVINNINTFKTLTFIGDHGTPQLIDTIYHENYWWLVATWIEQISTGNKMPERIIQMGTSLTKFDEINHPMYRFALSGSIPISVFDGTERAGYVVEIHPMAIVGSQGPKSIH